ncbi:MAG: acylphosphatase [Armatimonadota bacterium]|nr:MAG: acylphosphatase [Armatimonadota bacterium]
MPDQRLHATIRGRVQAVGFRAFVQRRAIELGLTGWVRNTVGDEVEVVAEGREKSLQALLGHLRRGPASARVEAVDAQWRAAIGEFRSFRITY